jgi:delta 1-pyrroline-5-carboxylate dehydrogenase
LTTGMARSLLMSERRPRRCFAPRRYRKATVTLAGGIAEVRKAADFCRCYASLAERQSAAPETLRASVGETNRLEFHGRDVIICIGPWNFPLAIFTGQVAAGLAAGDAVLAKPAEQVVRRAAPTGNAYVNRSMIGDVVSVQPFGGEGLSGTGPEAGGPHALLRFSVEPAVSVNITAQGGDPALQNLGA